MIALVTGGAGLIGSHVVDELLARGRDVRILDNLDAQTHPQGVPDWIPAAAEFVQGDVRDMDVLRQCLRDVDEIYHQAALWKMAYPEEFPFMRFFEPLVRISSSRRVDPSDRRTDAW